MSVLQKLSKSPSPSSTKSRRKTPPARGGQTKNSAPARKQISAAEEERARQEDAREAARVRAMAAKDEEVNQLFSEAVSLYKAQRGTGSNG